jgi:hypothetical protein
MRKRENWLFGFAAIGAVAAVLKILEYFQIGRDDWASLLRLPSLPSLNPLGSAIGLAAISLILSGYGIYLSHRRGKGPKRIENAAQGEASFGADRPNVILSHRSGTGELRVESLRTEAINVRLVPAESKNYRLRSDVIRCLKTGAPEILRLHCEAKRKGGSPVLEALGSPSLFFNDLSPAFDGDDERAAMERALTHLTEERVVFTLEVAYTGLSGSDHYRSSFLVRWEPLGEYIADVEPRGIRSDTAPPSSAPVDVIAPELALEYAGWLTSGTVSASNIHGGEATIVEVRNPTVRTPVAATDVMASILYENDSGSRRFSVSAKWLEMKVYPKGTTRQWASGISVMEGGESQFFVLWINTGAKMIVHNGDGEPIGELDYGHWRLTIQVTAANFQGFEGVFGFTRRRDGFEGDSPVFRTFRQLPPRFAAFT